MKRNELTEEMFYNWWLQKFHNTTIAELIEKEPELLKTLAWYKKYAVTQAQHDQWYEWAIDTICKNKKQSRKMVMRMFAINYLNLAPSVIPTPPSQ